MLHPSSEDICHKTFFDKKLEYYKKVSNCYFMFKIFLNNSQSTKISCFTQELEKQKSDYKQLFLENSEYKQEIASLKEQLEIEMSSTDGNNKCNDVCNDDLMLLQQKGTYTKMYIF